LRQLTDPATLPDTYFAFDGHGAIDTRLGLSKGASPISKYVLIPVEDHWALANVPLDFSGGRLYGYLKRPDAWNTTFEKKALAQIREQFPKHQLTPFYIDAFKNQESEVWILSAIVASLLLVGLGLTGYGAIRWWRAARESSAGGVSDEKSGDADRPQ
jgi:hypothetical protein